MPITYDFKMLVKLNEVLNRGQHLLLTRQAKLCTHVMVNCIVISPIYQEQKDSRWRHFLRQHDLKWVHDVILSDEDLLYLLPVHKFNPITI